MVGFFGKLFGKKDDAGERAERQGAAPNAMPASIEEGMAGQADEFVEAFSHPGSPVDSDKLDYSEESLALVDGLLDDFHRQQAPLPDDLHFLASAYVFEVARRQFGGRYLRGDEENPFVLVIGQGEAEVGVCVMAKVQGRVRNGAEDNIPFFYAGIAPLVAAGKRATLI